MSLQMYNVTAGDHRFRLCNGDVGIRGIIAIRFAYTGGSLYIVDVSQKISYTHHPPALAGLAKIDLTSNCECKHICIYLCGNSTFVSRRACLFAASHPTARITWSPPSRGPASRCATFSPEVLATDPTGGIRIPYLGLYHSGRDMRSA